MGGRAPVAAVRDLTAPARGDAWRTDRMRLLWSVATAANEATSVGAVMQTAVDDICTFMGWPVGHVFLLSASGKWLESTAIWHLGDSERYEIFKDLTATAKLVPGDAFLGHDLTHGPAVWLSDVASLDPPRGAAAMRAGLRSAVGCAVAAEGEVAAVLELFSPEPPSPDPELLQVMEEIAKQLSRVIERDRAMSKARYLALHDALTGLPNRSLLCDRLRQAIALAHRDARRVAVLFIDLDHFKAVNDTFGHQVGDAVLSEIALQLRSALREQDTVARFGGDEFAAVLPNTDRTGAVDAAKKMRHALDPLILVEGHECRIGATIGIAVYPTHGSSEIDLLRQADVAMYEAKRAGTGIAVHGGAPSLRSSFHQ